MKKNFLILYGLVIFAVTAGFILFGEHPRDPKFYVTMLVLVLIGKGIAHFIDGRE